MLDAAETAVSGLRARLSDLPRLGIFENEPLKEHTRFGIGGNADVLIVAETAADFTEALTITRASGMPWVVIGGGTNLVVADAGFRGAILKFAARAISIKRDGAVEADAGAVLQDLVDRTVAAGLRGLETMTGIPGWVGAAIYGNAGAYGRSISESVISVTFFDGEKTRLFDKQACQFHYRESIFKQRKDWIILGCFLQLEQAERALLEKISSGILATRNEKYPPAMRCAGSIFKNYLMAELPLSVQAMVPANVVREGKVPSAWFLEQVGAKGLRQGDIQVATYHANLIYNDGAGTASDLVDVIRRLKAAIGDRFGIPLEEEVQYIGDFSGT